MELTKLYNFLEKAWANSEIFFEPVKVQDGKDYDRW